MGSTPQMPQWPLRHRCPLNLELSQALQERTVGRMDGWIQSVLSDLTTNKCQEGETEVWEQQGLWQFLLKFMQNFMPRVSSPTEVPGSLPGGALSGTSY